MWGALSDTLRGPLRRKEENTMRRALPLIVLALPFALAGCWGQCDRISLAYDFRDGALGWQAGFADYGLDQEPDMLLEAGLRDLPPELNVEGTGFFIQGTNISDDLFMFLKRRLGPEDGIEPNQAYRIRFHLALASNAPSGCFGIGGAPGEAVYIKAGASPVEPMPVLDVDDHYRMNVDKGNQSDGGPAASTAGNVANGLPCDQVPDLEDAPYLTVLRRHRHEHVVTANADGELWLLVGTDSGFEGLTALYYRQIAVTLLPIRDG
jgi:hypothetical protein